MTWLTELVCLLNIFRSAAPSVLLGWDQEDIRGPRFFRWGSSQPPFQAVSFQSLSEGIREFEFSNAAFFFFFFLNTIPSVGLMHRQLHEGPSINILMSRGCEILLLWQEVFRAIINRGGNFNPNIITSLKLCPSASLMSSVELKSWKQQEKKKNHKT